jgi:hypothetical protein
VTDGQDSELAETLADVGRRVGQAISDVIDYVRPAFAALTDFSRRPEVQGVIKAAERTLQRRPCLCLCLRAHPDDRGICEMFDAVISGQHSSEVLGDVTIPLCAPCAAARAARQFGH